MFDKEYVYEICMGEVHKTKIQEILDRNPYIVVIEFLKDDNMYEMALRYSGIGFATVIYKKIPLDPAFIAMFGWKLFPPEKQKVKSWDCNGSWNLKGKNNG